MEEHQHFVWIYCWSCHPKKLGADPLRRRIEISLSSLEMVHTQVCNRATEAGGAALKVPEFLDAEKGELCPGFCAAS
jgi:hypothetical protein